MQHDPRCTRQILQGYAPNWQALEVGPPGSWFARPDRDRKPIDGASSRSNRHAGGPPQTACGLRHPVLRHQRRLDLLWARSNRPAPARGQLRQPHPQRREAGAAADQVRAGHQPQNGQGAGYSITACAPAAVGGMSMPSALAIFRLTYSSTLVPCWI